MSLVIQYWTGDVQASQGVSASEMTYIVSGGALNSTHSFANKIWHDTMSIAIKQIETKSFGVNIVDVLVNNQDYWTNSSAFYRLFNLLMSYCSATVRKI